MATVRAEDIVETIRTAGLQVSESIELQGREARFAPLPGTVSARVAERVAASAPSGLYTHQALSIGRSLEGHDVCLATPTASGKSLVFMTTAAELIAREPTARVLALYPAKALIQDQLEKWRAFAEPLGLKVGFIDGSVPRDRRPQILAECQIVAMTPDVTHAWLMSHLNLPGVRQFLNNMRLLVLDEAHVYDGAFGTNMAYLLRRLSRASGAFRVICSTATIGSPKEFLQQLTGRPMVVVDADEDGSQLFAKTLLLVKSGPKGGFDKAVALLSGLATQGASRFLAFGDSRKAVERLVGAVLRRPAGESLGDQDEADDADDAEEFKNWPKLEQVLPYRAGYEESDRQQIQSALSQGSLAGVVSTSALELGLDIGDLDVVVLLGTPPSVKAFRQRIGRAGRRRESVCILIDDQDAMSPLVEYLRRAPEPSWLYLENRYIQYANAICTAAELQASGVRTTAGLRFEGLPDSFVRWVENELNPTEAVEQELYAIKQRGQGNPHIEFPIRSAGEQQFKVEGPFGRELGSLSYGQALREAYPGAVYYYMARPFRIYSLEYKKGLIRAGKSGYLTTKPLTEMMAFPDFKNGVLNAWRSDAGFVTEVELQVNERVRGFTEQRGSAQPSVHEYGPGSSFNQKPISRPFKTTGVCWAFPEKLDRSEVANEALMRTFAIMGGIHERDLGVALFHANEGPFSPQPVKGAVVFDSTNGSLRLTERLAAEFESVVEHAAKQEGLSPEMVVHMNLLRGLVSGLVRTSSTPTVDISGAEGDWIRVIDRGQPALFITAEAPAEVTVIDFRYTPHGVMYQLEPLKPAGFSIQTSKGKLAADRSIVPNAPAKWMVPANGLQPLSGVTKMVRFNVVTGEEEPDR